LLDGKRKPIVSDIPDHYGRWCSWIVTLSMAGKDTKGFKVSSGEGRKI
jgi:hypothetical protein